MDLQVGGDLVLAEKIYQELLAENAANHDALHLLGLIRMQQGRTSTAIEYISEAISIRPDMPAFHHNIAGLYRRCGRMEDARAAYREALRLKPEYGEACQGLLEIQTVEADSPLMAQALEQVANPDLEPRVKSYFHFALARMFDVMADYQQAFSHYRQGNMLAGREFDAEGQRRLIQEVIYHYGPDQIGDGLGPVSDLPVFIVGMPRSGTSLVEQILSSHSGVFGAGELGDISSIIAHCQTLDPDHRQYPVYRPGLEAEHYQGLGQRYLQRLTEVADNSGPAPLRVIDKHPLNFQYLGFIFELLPAARVIHTRRNPLDTCLSCYFQNFSNGQDYSFDLHTLAEFYKDYRRLMLHWQQLYSHRIYHLDYERLVSDQENESRRLVEFLGLDWEETILDFHSTEREVKTASFLQVRQPLYKKSVDRWRRYQPFITELANDLGVELD